MTRDKIVDTRGLQPPQPFELAMAALCELAPDEVLVLVLDRDPVPLYRVLQRNGYLWTTTHEPDDGRFVVRIRPAT
jgi:uncharacterized protein (DUF2249 family)